ncbi:hypothetical protein DXC97_02705 [Lachnospiraceae bacterium TF09-5]|nr:hypothetical protein DXC97_02705 [Lachnospiraceae bacterium TF09-5]
MFTFLHEEVAPVQLHRILLNKSNKILRIQFLIKVKTVPLKDKKSHIIPRCCEKYINITIKSFDRHAIKYYYHFLPNKIVKNIL